LYNAQGRVDMKKAKKKVHKTTNRTKARAAKGKPKGPPPKALRKKKRTPRAVAPAPREVGLLDAIGEVMAVCEELAQEMHDWADNMPESKQSSQKHDEVEAAAETLDEVVGSDPIVDGVTSFLNDVKITIQDPTPSRRGRSRSTRLGDAIDIIGDVMQALLEYEGDKVGPNEQKAGELRNELEEIESNLQGVEFPGMFG
jgi:hypothetical protein